MIKTGGGLYYVALARQNNNFSFFSPASQLPK